jgi:Family of unknown function (DUF5519)
MRDELLATIEREVLTWPGVSKEPGRFNSVSFTIGRREIGHVHRNGVADLPFPRAVHDELIASGRARPHQAGVAGVVSVWLETPADVDQALALFRMNYDRALDATGKGRATAAAEEEPSETARGARP